MLNAEGRRTQAERRRAAEDDILSGAASVVAEAGLEGTTLGAIARRSGVSKALTIHHFGSKSALIGELVERAQARLRGALGEGVDEARSAPGTPALDIVRRAVQEYLEVYENPAPNDRALLALWGAMIPKHVEVDGVLDADRRSVAGWSGWIRLGQQDGSIRADIDPEATGATLMALTRGIAALRMIDPALVDAPSMRAACDHWVKAALSR